MSIEEISTTAIAEPHKAPTRVAGFIDGFNLYHALDKLDSATNATEEMKYQKYKWLCLRTLIGQFVLPETEELAMVEYFTAYPNWEGSTEKKRRHETYVGALRSRGVKVTFGEFKTKDTRCRYCQGIFYAPIEKQTDINIAVSMIERAAEYDKAILVTGDSDQVATINLLKRMHPENTFVSLAPIGRGSRDLKKACGSRFVMTEQHLIDSQLPNPLAITVNGKASNSVFVKPPTWQ